MYSVENSNRPEARPIIRITVRDRYTGRALPDQVLALELGGATVGWTSSLVTNGQGEASLTGFGNEVATLFVNGKPHFTGRLIEDTTVFVE